MPPVTSISGNLPHHALSRHPAAFLESTYRTLNFISLSSLSSFVTQLPSCFLHWPTSSMRTGALLWSLLNFQLLVLPGPCIPGSQISYVICKAKHKMKMGGHLFRKQGKHPLKVLKYKVFSFLPQSLSPSLSTCHEFKNFFFFQFY